ncbi:glycosyltransferase family 2 protein [Ferrovibrio sp.]|uniref:glycosyltransferase family 2 protein n=1 Tax=Ferrovibrio sp. TaxID=1917215 RepID=UPI003D2E2BD9
MACSAVIVAYNSGSVIDACLQSLGGIDDIVVVDNAADEALRQRPGIRYIRNQENLGFGRGCNTGVAAAKHDLVLLVNPDAVLEPGALDTLLAAARAYPEAALLMPAILNADGHAEPSHDAGLFEKRAMPKRQGEPEPEGDLCANFLSGAVLLLRKPVFEAIGGFDPKIFMYFEDDDLSLRLRQAGHVLVRVNAARARHIGGGSSGPSDAVQRFKQWHFAWSRLYIERKFNGTAAAWRHGLPMLLKHAIKALLYGLAGKHDKASRDGARARGFRLFLCGQRPPTKI